MTKPNTLACRLRAGKPVISGWSSLAVPEVVELMARGGLGAVTLDMQHGQHDLASVREGLAALKLADAARIVRVPVGETATASRVIDLGAEAVIAPMINSVAEARDFADAVKYPPLGRRSWGPGRAAMLAGMEAGVYLETANDTCLALAMIETPEAIAALDDILAVPGIDGVFVGPSDLSLTLSQGEKLDPDGIETQRICADIAKAANSAGKISGIYCLSAEKVRQAWDMGFVLMAYGFDTAFLMDGASRVSEALSDPEAGRGKD